MSARVIAPHRWDRSAPSRHSAWRLRSGSRSSAMSDRFSVGPGLLPALPRRVASTGLARSDFSLVQECSLGSETHKRLTFDVPLPELSRSLTGREEGESAAFLTR